MKRIKLLSAIVVVSLLFSCSGNKTSPQDSSDNSLQQSPNSNAKGADSSVQQINNSSSQHANPGLPQIVDTNKMETELNAITDLVNEKPDSNKLKKTAADILSTDAAVLSDSGISKIYGNSNDPSVNMAKNMLIKMRNSMGITPGKLDSIKKSAAMLAGDSISRH